ncbi:helix-turn-helix transcriptional regulator [Streptomyces sp. B-S-A8]|uniref:Helix-turn-helix transcriptional regulator n=1 Tax=Streptomyces solicavernae TaxID=3043614 RepID=A0ABT6RUX4_9ACTN|nr:helix-turn-helix transcriptional regulator [Streptomyces sp. B-S-A8]MDI3388229.1 helix-turn-helix transcriptional regulator [Streptomyces sp. B-S-A8]
MPPRGQPTARQARLGAELRKLREASGMSSAEAAASLGWERPQVSHIESGRYGVSGERVRHLAAHYSASDDAYVNALAAMADDRSKGWWVEFRNILPARSLDLAELEHHAVYLRSIQPLIVPGLLQTEEYAQAIFAGAVTKRPAAEIDAAVAHRMKRREIFERPDPPDFEVLLHEAALRICYGTRDVMRRQLGFLTEVATHPAITLRVIPFAAAGMTSALQPLTYAGAVVSQLDTVQVDNAFDGVFLDAGAQLGKYRAVLDATRSATLNPTESRKVIRSIAKEL